MRNRVSLLFIITILACNLFPYSVSASSITLTENYLERIAFQAADDSFEENDTSGAAKVLQTGLYGQLTCRDDDWYKIELDEKVTLTIAVAFNHTDGNIDIQLFQSDGLTKMAESISITDNEHIRLADLNAGTYLLKVYSPQNQPNDYGLAIVFNNAGLAQIESTDNDWYLPPGVKRDRDSGFYKLGLKNPSYKIPILSPGGWVWSWKDLNPGEGIYRFDKIQNKIKEVEGTPYAIGLRIKCSQREFIPDWVVQKHNPPVVTFTGGSSDLPYVSPWHPGVEAEFYKFIDALGKTGIPKHPQIVFSQIHGFSSSQGEELNLQGEDFQKAVNHFGLTPDVYYNWAIRRINAWLKAFEGVEYKLMWSGHEESLRRYVGDAYCQASSNVVKYALEHGIGFRGGIIEMYYGERFARDESTGQGLVPSVDNFFHMYRNTSLDFPVIAERRANGDENEEYWCGIGTSDTLPQKRHRWLMSNLWALTMGVRFQYAVDNAYDLDPAFSEYVQKSMGKTVDNSLDGWVFLNEGYKVHHINGRWRDIVVKNLERFLYQRDFPGAKTVAVEKVYRGRAGGENMSNPPWEGNNYFDYVARRTDRANGNDRMYFDVEDRFIHNEPQTILLKTTYKDDNNARWHVEYDAGPDGILSTSTVTGADDGQWKTATFILSRAAFAGQLPYEQDLTIVTETDDVTVKYVRIIKWSQPDDTVQPTNTPTPTLLPTDTPTLSPTSTLTPTATNTPPPTYRPTPTSVSVPSPTNTPTPADTPTPTTTNTPPPTYTPTPVPTDTPTPTTTNTPPPTHTPTFVPTDTPTPAPTSTLTPTPTETLPTFTPTATSTVPPTYRLTPTPANTPSPTDTPTLLPTDTPSLMSTPTSPPTPTATSTLSSMTRPTPTPDATVTSTFIGLSLDEPLFAGVTVVKGNGIPGTLIVVRDLDDLRIVAEGGVNSEGRYEIDLASVLATCQLDGLEAGHRIQAESEGQICQATVQPQIAVRGQVFLPFVSKGSLSNSGDGDSPPAPPR